MATASTLVALTITLSGCSSTLVEEAKEPENVQVSLTFDNLDIDLVRPAAFAEINDGITASAAFTPSTEFILGPSLKQDRIDQEKEGLNRAANFWSDIYTPKKTYIAYFTQDDIDWADKEACDKFNYCPTRENEKISFMIKDNAPKCTSAFSNKTNNGTPFFAQCLGVGSQLQKNRQTGSHEYFHWVQQKYVDWQSTPNWFLEGSADYFGDAISVWNGPEVPPALDRMQHETSRNWIEQDRCSLKVLTVKAITECFKYTYNQEQGPVKGSSWDMSSVSYYMGSQATEAMIAVKGLDTFKALLRDCAKMSFDKAFQKHYGLTTDEFYPKVAKYVLEMYKDSR